MGIPGVCLLVLVVLALHFSTVMQPAEPVFDEKHYVPDASSLFAGQGTVRTEHPPLGRLFIASGIWLFGENPFGWRLLPILFGSAGIIFFYLVCRQLKMTTRIAYLATFLLSFENLSFVQSSVAMLDVFSLTFMLESFWLWLRGHHAAAGVLAGLAALSKLNALAAFPILGLHWVLTREKRPREFLTFVATALATFFMLMPALDFVIWHRFLNPFAQTERMLKISASYTFAGAQAPEMLSRPWDWLLRPEILAYWISPHYLAMISPTIWVFVIPATAFVFFRAFKGDVAALFASIWFAGMYLIWIPVSLITDRISFVYYFYPSVGAVCMALSLVAMKVSNAAEKQPVRASTRVAASIVPTYLLLCLGAFVVLTPVSYWWKLSLCVAAYVASRHFLSASKNMP